MTHLYELMYTLSETPPALRKRLRAPHQRGLLMRRFVFLWALLLSAIAASAQTSTVNGFCTLGGTKAATQGMNSTNSLQGIIPSCTITVYVTGTTTRATIYSDVLHTPLSNPFTASSKGAWLFWADSPPAFDVTGQGGGGNP